MNFDIVQPKTFSRNQLYRVMAVGLVSGLCALVGWWLLMQVDERCFTTTGSCTVQRYGSLLALFAAQTVVAALALKRLGVINYWPVVVLPNFLIYLIVDFSLLGEGDWPKLALIAVPAFVAAYALFYWIFHGFALDMIDKLVIVSVVMLVAGGSAVYLLRRINTVDYRAVQQAKINAYDFTLYRPTYLPAGYRLYSVSASYSNDPAPYLTQSYLYGTNEIGDPSPFTIYQFNASWQRFDPPRDCGPEYPTTILSYAFPCPEAGVLASGETVYHYDSTFSNNYNTYVKKGDTVVVLAVNDRRLQLDEQLKILNSLKTTTAAELENVRKLSEF